MSDEELIARLRDGCNLQQRDGERAANRIEALIAERNDWESHAIYNAEFVDLAVSYRNERDAARAELAKVVKTLEQERDEAIRRRDAWKAKAEGYDAVRKALREKVGAPWPPNLSRALWAGIAADEKKRADDAEAKLEELRQALLWCSGSADFNEGGVARKGWLKVCAPLLKGESNDPL